MKMNRRTPLFNKGVLSHLNIACTVLLCVCILFNQFSITHSSAADPATDTVPSVAEEQTSHLIDLDDKSFYNFISDNSLVMVMYYAPWCFWSRATLPELEAAARVLIHKNPAIRVGKIDCTIYSTLGDNESIREYPTIRFFIDGEPVNYEGRRTRTHFIHWIHTKLDRDHEITNISQFTEIMNGHYQTHTMVFAILPEKVQALYRPAFNAVARAFGEDVFFADITSNNYDVTRLLKNEYLLPMFNKNQIEKADFDLLNAALPDSDNGNGGNSPLILVFTPHQQADVFENTKVHVYKGKIDDIKDLRSFIRQYLFPIVSIFSAELLSASFFGDPRPKAIMAFKTDQITQDVFQGYMESNQIVKEFYKSCQAYRKAIVCLVTGNSKGFERQLLSSLGIDEEESGKASSTPVLRIMSVNHDSDGKHHPAHKYKPDFDLKTNANQISNFFERYIQNKIPPYFRSEALPDLALNKSGLVNIAVGTIFNQMVMDPTKDVFIEFYAPWCGYCRKMEPAYKLLAKKLKAYPSITVAKIDATRNEVDGIRVNGYPTLFLYPANSKESPIVYSGDRSTSDMLNWLSSRVQTVQFDASQVMARQVIDDSGDTGIVLEEL